MLLLCHNYQLSLRSIIVDVYVLKNIQSYRIIMEYISGELILLYSKQFKVFYITISATALLGRMWNLYDFLRTWAFKESLYVQVDNFKLYSHAFLFSSPIKAIIDKLANFFRKEIDHFHSPIIHLVIDSQYSVNPLLYMKMPRFT